MSKKDTTTMNTEIKSITDATLELGRKTTQTINELGSRAMNDMLEYVDAVSKVQTGIFGTPPVGFNSVTEGWNKMQSEMFNGYSNWIDSIKNLTK